MRRLCFCHEHLPPHRRDHSADTGRDHLFRRAAWRRRRRQGSWIRIAAWRHQVRKSEREFPILFSYHHVDRLVDRPDIDHAALLLRLSRLWTRAEPLRPHPDWTVSRLEALQLPQAPAARAQQKGIYAGLRIAELGNNERPHQECCTAIGSHRSGVRLCRARAVRRTLRKRRVTPRLYVPSTNEATHPRCCDEGYPDGPGRASNKEGES